MLRSAQVLWTVGAFIATARLGWAGSSVPSGLIAEAESLRALDTAESLRQAAVKYEEALPLWRRLGKTSEEAGAFHQLGVVYDSLGDCSSARGAFLEALRLRRALRDRRGESASLTSLAGVTEQLGDLDPALRYLRQSLRLSRSIADKLGEARALYRMGCIHDKLPAVRCVGYSCRLRALAFLREAFSLFQRVGDLRGQGDALSRAAMNYEGIGDRKKALEFLEQALNLHRRAADRRGEARVFYNLGYLHLWSGAYSEALESFQRALELRRQVGDRAGEIATVMPMGRAAHGLGRLQQALGYFEDSVQMVEAERAKLKDPDLRASYFSTKENYYGHYIDALMDLHRSEPSGAYAARALQASERMKARTLIEVMGDSQPEAAFGIDQIRWQVLDDDTLLLEYARGVADLYVWAVSRTGTYGFSLGDLNRIQAAAVRWRDLLQRSRDDASIRRACDRAGAELSRLLLGPVARLLGTKRLLMVMDATLQDLPLAALPKPGPDGVPLGFEHEVVALPSARTLFVMRSVAPSRPLPPKSVAVLADPVFDRHDPRVEGSKGGLPRIVVKSREGTDRRLPRLPFSRKEATAIVSLASPEESLLAVDFAANRQTATSPMLREYKIVHFATHALVDPVRPENSRLGLSLVDQAGAPQNGFLGLRDIYNLRLPVELVVLSACQTGLGKDVRGEGIISLSRGFLAAGARRVLVSLWKIDDEATAEFMRQFYLAMLTGPGDSARPRRCARHRQPCGTTPAGDRPSTGRDSFYRATGGKRAGHMKPPWAVNRKAFDRLLEWLGPDRETSAREYERIRATLIRIFEWRGARNCEELADETFDRAARRLQEGAILEGSDPYPYLHGVAVRVLHDHRQKVASLAAAILSTPRPVLPSPAWEARLACLDEALAQLNRRDRQLIRAYYQGQKRDKVDNRRCLAEQMGISVNALRIRVLRIRERLDVLVADCLRRWEP